MNHDKAQTGIVTSNTQCLVIVIFSDEVEKRKILLLCLDRYLFSVGTAWVAAIDAYPEIVKKMYSLLLLL